MLRLPNPKDLSKPSKIDTNSEIPSRKVTNKSLANESISTQQMEFNDFLDGMKSISAVATEAHALREFGTGSTEYVGQANIKSEEGEFIWYCDLDPKGDISRARAKSCTSASASASAGTSTSSDVHTPVSTQTLLSPPFIAGFSIGIPCEWSIQLLIGENQSSGAENYIGLGLRLNKFLRCNGSGSGSSSSSRSFHVAVHYQVAHISETGQCIQRKESAIRTFGPDDLDFGWTEFLLREALVPDSDGQFIFAVYLTMYEMTIPEAYDKQVSDAPIPRKRRRTEAEDSIYTSNSNPPNQLRNTIFTLAQINYSYDGDVELFCRGEKFLTTLKSLTDHSDYFKKIATEVQDRDRDGHKKGEHHIFPKMPTPRIEIDFCDPSTLQVVLDFCRTKQSRGLSLLPDYTSVLALLQAAIKLGISGLEKMCVVEILCLLTPENFPPIVYNLWFCKAKLVQAEKDVLHNFFETNRERITKGGEFKNFYRQNPLLFFDMLL